MSNQEMQFADPDWEPTHSAQQQGSTSQSTTYSPQPVNDDQRERFQQPTVETSPQQEEVYAGLPPYSGAIPEQPRQAPYQYQQMPYRQPRRRHRAWFWIILVILFFGLMSGGASAFGNIGQKSVTQNVITNLAPGTPTIIINEADGNIHVQQGGSLNIQEVKKSGFFDDPNNIPVKVEQSGSTITISVDQGSGFLSARSVDFNITVPQEANLQLTTTSGDISVNDTSGAISLTTDSGNISTVNDTFSNQTVLNTDSGNIHSTGDTFNSQANITVDSGDVEMNQDVLNGPATVKTSSGNIDFNGSIASSAAYQFTTDSGDVHVGLPVGANFTVQADTSSGSIDAGDFPSISVQDQGSGSHASGTVGSSSGSSIKIGTGSGDITIHQR